MSHWETDKKIAATILLALLGISYLAGVAKVWVSVGLSPEKIERRYSASGHGEADLESFLDGAPPPVSFEKLAHISHAHLMPYTFLFAVLSFFVVSLSWSVRMKTVFFASFALSIIGDFASMFLTRFVYSGFYALLLVSGLVFGLCVGSAILAALHELWFRREEG